MIFPTQEFKTELQDLMDAMREVGALLLQLKSVGLCLFHPTCHVFTSSGYNKGKGKWKCSAHLYWPQLRVEYNQPPQPSPFG